MNDAAFLELLASYEQALEAARRSLVIARELADAHQDGRRLPDAAVTAYRNGLARDEETFAAIAGQGGAVSRVVSDALRREMSSEGRMTHSRELRVSTRALGLQRRMYKAKWLAEDATAVVDALLPDHPAVLARDFYGGGE